MHVGNPMMKEHLHGEQWMNVAKFPEMAFEAESAANVKTEGDTTTADLTGTMTIKGIARKMTVPAKLTYLKDKLGARVPNLKGDLLVVRATFSVKRKDFGINAGKVEEKVADAIELNLSVAGASPR